MAHLKLVPAKTCTVNDSTELEPSVILFQLAPPVNDEVVKLGSVHFQAASELLQAWRDIPPAEGESLFKASVFTPKGGLAADKPINASTCCHLLGLPLEQLLVAGFQTVTPRQLSDRLATPVTKKPHFGPKANERPLAFPKPKNSLATVHPHPFFSYSADGGFVLHETAEQARSSAQHEIDLYRADAAEGWPEDVATVCWGKVMGRALQEECAEPYLQSSSAELVNYRLADSLSVESLEQLPTALDYSDIEAEVPVHQPCSEKPKTPDELLLMARERIARLNASATTTSSAKQDACDAWTLAREARTALAYEAGLLSQSSRQ